MTAYVEPGKVLGKSVEYKDGGITWVFPVPERYQGEKDAILVVEHPHFTIKNDENRRTILADEQHVSLVRNFPADILWYPTGANGIPCGERINSWSKDARALHRADKRVGPIARASLEFDGRRLVLLGDGPSERFGMAVEAGEAGAPEKLAMEREAGRLIPTGSDEQLENGAAVEERLADLATKLAPLGIDVLVAAEEGVSAEEALKKASGKVIASNKTWDSMLVGCDEWEKAKESLPVWTGTMTAFAEPGEKLGNTVEHKDRGITWVFPVPVKFQDERDACLVVEHPHFTVKADGNTRTVIVDDERSVRIVQNLPAKNGWYKTDAGTGIPSGAKIDSESKDARYLYRADKRVGPIARDFDGDGRGVGLGDEPSERFGVAVEAGEAGAPEKLAMEREAGRLVLTGLEEQLKNGAKPFEKLNLG